MIREFRLSPPRSGRGVSCDTSGAYVGSVPLLKRSNMHGKDRWEPRNCEQLSKQLGSEFGLPIDLSMKAGGLKAICNALNEGDVARAQIATVLLGIPDPPPSTKRPHPPGEMIKFIRDLNWSGLIKADWDPDEHPRWPAGAPDGQGGEFAPKGEGAETDGLPISHSGTAVRTKPYNPDKPRDESRRRTNGGRGTAELDAADDSTHIQLADADMSDASDDPVAEAAARSAAAARRNSGAAHSPVKPVRSEHEDFWQTLGSRLSHEAQSALSEVGRAQLNESNANIAVAAAGAKAIADGLRAYENYRAKPWIGPDGVRVQVPVISADDPYTGQSARIAYERSDPNAPLTRPGTNADWIDALVDVASAGAMVAGPALRVLGAGGRVASPTLRVVGAGARVAADSLAADSEFAIAIPELPKTFNITWPIGKIEIPENLAPGTDLGNYMHDRIGKLFQGIVPDVKLILNTDPGVAGPDMRVPENAISRLGFEYAEIKPLSRTGLSRFKNQVLNVWDLEGQVLPITYDYDGNIYYGFSGPWR